MVDADINAYSIDGFVISFHFKKKSDYAFLPANYCKPNWGDSARAHKVDVCSTTD